jgi:hypothetical protein
MAFTNVLNDMDISLLLQNETVATILSSTETKTRFRIALPDTIKEKLKSGLGLDLFSVEEVPMMYIRGDMEPHVDSGVSDFKNTYLVYLTDSGGKFIVDNTEYDIQKGCGFKFERGLLHGTTGTGDEGRLMIGPLSDMGFEVGGSTNLMFTLTSASTTGFTINVVQLEVGSQSTDLYEFQFYKNAGQSMSTYTYVWNPTLGSITTDYATIVGGPLTYSPGDTFNVAIKNKGVGGQFRFADNNTGRNITTFNDVTVPGGGGGGVSCFVAASNLLTSTGYKSAKDIKTGDLLMTADGRQVPIKAFTFTVKTDKTSAPYFIPKNSLARNVPANDLRLSPWHAICLGNGLWQKPQSAAELNPGSVTQYDIGKDVQYYHFEATNYFTDNFICEGTVVESFSSKQLIGKARPYTWSAKYQAYTRYKGNSKKSVA